MRVLTIKGGADFSGVPNYASIWYRNTIFFDMRRILDLKEPPAKHLKTYLKDIGIIYFVVI